MAKTTTIAGNTFLFTGKLTEFTREDAEAHIEAEGGKVLSGVSAKLNYLVVGEDAGSKLKKAEALGTVTILHEKEFLKMMNSGKKTPAKAVTKAEPKKPTTVLGRNVTRFTYKITGYGSEIAWVGLNKGQIKYWGKVYKSQSESSSQRELVDHIRHGSAPEENKQGYIGPYYDWNDEFEEYPYFEGSKLIIELFGGKEGNEVIDKLEISLDDKKIKKSFFKGFIKTSITEKVFSKGIVFARTEDEGEFCRGEREITEKEDRFSIDKFYLSVEKIQGLNYVSMIEYDEIMLDCEVGNDTWNKGFDAWIIWTN